MTTNYQNQAGLLLKECALSDSFVPCTSILCGIFACKLVYDASQLISTARVKVYNGLSREQQVEWNNRAISTVHAVFITFMSIYFTFWSDLFADDEQKGLLIFRGSSLSSFVLGVSVGYFISDLAMILWFYPALGGLEYVLHHMISMGALAYAMYISEGQFYVYLLLTSETTTPSINLRWYLDAVGAKRSRAYIINGVFIFLTWIVARIFLFMYTFYHLFMHFDQLKELPKFGFVMILLIPAVLSALNLTWFTKIARGMLKTLEKRE